MATKAANLTKLSIDLLADAFTHEEKEGRLVFAIYGREDTLLALRNFLTALGRGGGGRTVWGSALVAADPVPVGAIIVGSKNASREVNALDYVAALELGLKNEAGGEVSGRLVRLQ